MDQFVNKFVESLKEVLRVYVTEKSVDRRRTMLLVGAEEMLTYFGAYRGTIAETEKMMADAFKDVIDKLDALTLDGVRLNFLKKNLSLDVPARIKAARRDGGDAWLYTFMLTLTTDIAKEVIKGRHNGALHTCWEGTFVGNTAHCPEDIRFLCWDGSRALTSADCPERGTVACWDGSRATDASLCPPQQATVRCWDGTSARSADQCPRDTRTLCWDGSVALSAGRCPPQPDADATGVTCWDGSQAATYSSCPPQTNVPCWDGSRAPTAAQCPADRRVRCWDGSLAMNTHLCPRNTSVIKCWDGSTGATCPPKPATKTCSGGVQVPFDEPCPSSLINVWTVIVVAVVAYIAYTLWKEAQDEKE